MSKQGFTLIELIIITAIIGLTLSVAMPAFQYFFPAYEQKQFITRLSALTQAGWQQALSSGRMHRIIFDIENKKIRLETEKDQKDAGQLTFGPADIAMINTEFNLPAEIEIRQFYVSGEEFFARAGISTETVWFYIMPDGLTQDVVINFVNTKQLDAQNQPRRFSAVLNPFSARFAMYEEFRKP